MSGHTLVPSSMTSSTAGEPSGAYMRPSHQDVVGHEVSTVTDRGHVHGDPVVQRRHPYLGDGPQCRRDVGGIHAGQATAPGGIALPRRRWFPVQAVALSVVGVTLGW